VRYDLDGRMARDAQAVVRAPGELVPVGARSVHVMTIHAGLERGAVTVFLRLDEIRILLVVFLGVLGIAPEISGCS